MRRLHSIALLASSFQLCHARQPSFSIHDDVLAYPQFEIVFSDHPIPESEALSLLDTNTAHPTYEANLASQTDLSSGRQVRESTAADPPPSSSPNDPHSSSSSYPSSDDSSEIILSHTHTLLHLPPQSYLCSIPHLAPPPPPNQTATALLKAEEARELARASAAGWDIMTSALEGQCLYYMSGWWSYSFCYGKEIVQFHALPNGLKNGVPARDPGSAEYVLGRVHYDQQGGRRYGSGGGGGGGKGGELEGRGGQGRGGGAENGAGAGGAGAAPPNSELAVKDNQRYLLQRLDGGTLCDLTGRERTIEVQYHCHPGIPGDRIGWIKEVTTCTYLMVVQTPRLCADVAFLPPKEGKAHAVECRPVGDGNGRKTGWLEGVRDGVAGGVEGVAEVVLSAARVKDGGKTGAKGEKEKGKADAAPVTIGGVVVGGRKVLGTGADGSPAARLPSPRHLGGAGKGGGVVEILAQGFSKTDGGKVEALTREQLEALQLDSEAVEELRKELQQLAGEHGWKLEVVEVPGEAAEIRGIIDTPDDDAVEEDQEVAAAKREKERQVKERAGQVFEEAKGRRKEERIERARAKKVREEKKGGGEEEEEEESGSEERFKKDEL